MELSKLEFMAMNNPIRRLIQKHVEFSIFRSFLFKHGIDLENKAILDVGCGSGYSTELIVKTFKPSEMQAFDLMPRQIELAKKRKIPVNFFVGDATKMTFGSNLFDAVFVFGVLHHIPNWQETIAEIARVTKKNGVLLIEEIAKSLLVPLIKLGFMHPEEALFEWKDFEDVLNKEGFVMLAKKKIVFKGIQSYLWLKE